MFTIVKIFKIENYFLLFFLIYGSIYAIITPPFYVSDEMGHFNKAASKEIVFFNSDLKISKSARDFSKYEKFNYYIYKKYENYKFKKSEILNTKSIFFWDNEIVDATTQSLKNYPITGYWPQKIGINISKLFTDKILYSFYAGRLFNLFVCSLIIFACLKKISNSREIVIVICFLPMTLSIMGSHNQDAIFISYTILLITIISSLIEKYNVYKLLSILMVSTILIITKPPYLPIYFVVYYFILEYVKKAKFKYFNIFSVIFIFLICIYISNYEIDKISENNKIQQIKFLLTNPLIYIEIIFKDLAIHFPKYVMGVIGHLGHNDILFNKLYYYIYLLFISLIILISFLNNLNIFNLRTFVILFSCIFIFLSLQLSQYLYFTAPGKTNFIQGLVGRYLLPIIIIFSLIFPKANNYKLKNLNKNILLIIPHLNIWAIYKLYIFFY